MKSPAQHSTSPSARSDRSASSALSRLATQLLSSSSAAGGGVSRRERLARKRANHAAHAARAARRRQRLQAAGSGTTKATAAAGGKWRGRKAGLRESVAGETTMVERVVEQRRVLERITGRMRSRVWESCVKELCERVVCRLDRTAHSMHRQVGGAGGGCVSKRVKVPGMVSWEELFFFCSLKLLYLI